MASENRVVNPGRNPPAQPVHRTCTTRAPAPMHGILILLSEKLPEPAAPGPGKRRPAMARYSAKEVAAFDDVETQMEAMEYWHRRQSAESSLPFGWKSIEDKHPCGRKQTRVTLRLDEDVAKFFRRMGPGYQTRVNAVLRLYMLARAADLLGDRGVAPKEKW